MVTQSVLEDFTAQADEVFVHEEILDIDIFSD